MGALNQVLNIVRLAAALFFPLWPLVLLLPLFRPSRNLLASIGVTWIIMLVVRSLARGAPSGGRSYLIPEPWNSTLFFVVGIGLLIANVVVIAMRVRKDFELKDDGHK